LISFVGALNDIDYIRYSLPFNSSLLQHETCHQIHRSHGHLGRRHSTLQSHGLFAL